VNAEKLISNGAGALISIAALGAAAQLSISLPESVSVAPITGQSLAVLLIAHLLKETWATIAVGIYILIGILGAPVFAGFEGGWEKFSGPSLGYFVGFIAATIVCGLLARKQEERFKFYFLQMFIGSVLILLCGWLGLFRFLDAKTAFVKGVLPFLPGALIKLTIGAILLSVIRRFKGFMKAV
tara:strand:+ start:13 stop:561 length:549 start_codon:yes stop_codon:yes gene_type:complete